MAVTHQNPEGRIHTRVCGFQGFFIGEKRKKCVKEKTPRKEKC